MADKRPKIEVRFDNNEVKERLSKQAKQRGYPNREAYLQEVLTKLAFEEYESDVAALYRQSLDRVVLAIQPVYDALMLNAQLGLMKLPTEIMEMRNEDDQGES